MLFFSWRNYGFIFFLRIIWIEERLDLLVISVLNVLNSKNESVELLLVLKTYLLISHTSERIGSLILLLDLCFSSSLLFYLLDSVSLMLFYLPLFLSSLLFLQKLLSLLFQLKILIYLLCYPSFFAFHLLVYFIQSMRFGVLVLLSRFSIFKRFIKCEIEVTSQVFLLQAFSTL